MGMDHTGDDIDATAVMPQLDIRILSAALERVEPPRTDAAVDMPVNVARDATPEWKVADQLAALKDQVASLQAALRENENRHSRLAMRHETLLQKFEERESVLVDNQLALNQARKKLTSLEQQLQLAAVEAADMRQTVTASIQQRRQREQFILKQAGEIKRLRELLP
jgi:chromosome segregation ATPase